MDSIVRVDVLLVPSEVHDKIQLQVAKIVEITPGASLPPKEGGMRAGPQMT